MNNKKIEIAAIINKIQVNEYGDSKITFSVDLSQLEKVQTLYALTQKLLQLTIDEKEK